MEILIFLISFLYLRYLLYGLCSDIALLNQVKLSSRKNLNFMQEAKQALELMHKWESIDLCDALELLSPVFESEEVIVKH